MIAIARGFMFTGNPEIDGEIRTLLETVKRAEEENIFVITTFNPKALIAQLK